MSEAIATQNSTKSNNALLVILAGIWYGSGLLDLLSVPFLWNSKSAEIIASSEVLNSLFSSIIFIPWVGSAILLPYAIRSVIQHKSKVAFLVVLHIFCAFLTPFIWVFFNIIEGAPFRILENFSYISIGLMVGIFTFGLIFTSFLPVFSTFIAFKIIKKQMIPSFTMRTFCIFLLFLGSWLIVLFTGVVFGNA